MANKSLNNSLDAHLSKVRGGTVTVKKKKEKTTNPFLTAWKSFVSGVKKIKHYFFAPPSYEQTTLSGQGVAVVSAIDRGFKKHVKMLFASFKKKTAKKEKEIVED